MLPNRTDQCTIRAFDGCDCQPGECRSAAVPMQRFTKPRPMPHDTTGWQYAAVFVFTALVLFWGATFGYPEQQRLDRIAQEQGR